MKISKSDLNYLIKGKNKSIRKSSKVRHNGRLFNRPEDVIHYEVIQMLINEFPTVLWSSNILDGVKLGFGVQKKYAGMRNRKGTLDLIILKAKAGYFGMVIDFKIEKGTISNEQAEFIRVAKANNYYAGIAGSGDDAISIIRKYLLCEDTKCK